MHYVCDRLVVKLTLLFHPFMSPVLKGQEVYFLTFLNVNWPCDLILAKRMLLDVSEPRNMCHANNHENTAILATNLSYLSEIETEERSFPPIKHCPVVY